MNWNSSDNKNYTGKIDRIFVSDTESYEVDYFVDQYLKTRNYAINDTSRKIIRDWLATFPGRAPHKRDDLNRFLDTEIAKANAAKK